MSNGMLDVRRLTSRVEALTLFVVPILILQFVLLLMPATVQAQGSVICVSPIGDYPTIQEAVDAASDGDEIRVAGGTYSENVVITKTLTMSGKWRDNCSEINTDPNAATALIPDQGRAITIYPVAPGVEVGISSMSMKGDATGLGGADKVAGGLPITHTTGSDALSGAQVAAAHMPDDWRAQIAQLAEQGFVPGASSPTEVLERIDAFFAPDAAVQVAAMTIPDTPAKSEEIDCGGALYAKGAGLTLSDIGVSVSVASTTGDGYGGGACIIDPPASGVLVKESQFIKNTGSLAGAGIGGGLFIQGGESGSVRIEDTIFQFNYASAPGDGWGGGLALIDVPQPVLSGTDSCVFAFNVASKAGNGSGGGALLLRTASAAVGGCRFFTNYASAGSNGSDDIGNASSGFGGGLYAEECPQIAISSSKFDFNVAQTGAPESNRRAEGGGAFVVNSFDAAIQDNVFDRNIAGFSGQGFGGGLVVLSGQAFAQVTGVSVSGNQFAKNWANVVNFIGGAGGGLFIYGIADSTITTNTFTANVVNLLGEAGISLPDTPYLHGGGLAVDSAQNVQIAGNKFVENAATVGGFGLGGGLGLRKTGPAAVIDNEFRRNLANNALSGSGLGGACAIQGGYQNQPIMLQGNIFNDNSGSLSTDADPGSATSAIALIGDNLAAPDLPAIDLRNVTIDRNRILGSGRNLPVDTPPNNFAISIQGADLFTITNNVIAGSTLGGIVAIHKLFDSEGNTFETRGAIHNNTFYANGDYGLWLLSRWTTSALSLVNNSIVSHTFGVEGEDLYGPAAPVTLSYTLFYSNSQEIGPDADDSITSTHTIVGNPQFLSPTAYDFHLMPNSAAIDAGDPAGIPPAPAVDIDGALRPYGPRVDVGAYEWQGQGALLPIIAKE